MLNFLFISVVSPVRFPGKSIRSYHLFFATTLHSDLLTVRLKSLAVSKFKIQLPMARQLLSFLVLRILKRPGLAISVTQHGRRMLTIGGLYAPVVMARITYSIVESTIASGSTTQQTLRVWRFFETNVNRFSLFTLTLIKRFSVIGACLRMLQGEMTHSVCLPQSGVTWDVFGGFLWVHPKIL